MPVAHLPGSPVTGATFDAEVLTSDLPVLVDFWAQWCPPCHMISPTLAEIARERAGSLVVRTVDTDENPELAARFRVLSLPTLMLVRGGQVVWTVVGARSKARLVRELDTALAQ